MRSRNQIFALSLFVCALFAFALPALASGDSDSDSERGRRIKICHFPPGNPANFQTITVRGRAWRHHARHGDLLGSCAANCEDICDDGDACTQDAESDLWDCICLPIPVPVDCDDGVSCTDDSCDPTDGTCSNVNTCDDGNPCTADLCNNGECTVPPVSGCLFTPVADGTVCDDGDAATENDACTDGTCAGEVPDPCAGVVCQPLDQCHVAGTCTDGVCDDPVAADGTACDDGDAATTGDVCTAGVCAGSGNTDPDTVPGGLFVGCGTTCVREDLVGALCKTPTTGTCLYPELSSTYLCCEV